MKKIIDGKLYNTETADQLGEFWNGLGNGDFRNINEALYRTKKGTYFRAGCGGAMTEYAEVCEGGRSRCGGENIFPLTEEEAKSWAEAHLSADEYAKIFGEPEEA